MLQSLKSIIPFASNARRSLPFNVLFKKFKSILERNNRILEMMADMGDKLSGEYVFDRQYLVSAVELLSDLVFKLISDYSVLNERKNRELFLSFAAIQHQIQEELSGRHLSAPGSLVVPLADAGQYADELNGSKMAVLAQLHSQLQMPIPEGFVITTRAFFDFMRHNEIPEIIEQGIASLNGRGQEELKNLSALVQKRIMQAEIPRPLLQQIEEFLKRLQRHHKPLVLALRSSAWGEGEDAGFAGQYLSVLNVPRSKVAGAYRRVLAGTYAHEAWRYRLDRDYREHEIAMAVGCQVMLPSSVSGVLHTYADHADRPVILINAVWGLGAPLLNGEIGADSYFLSRTAPYQVLASHLVDKARRLTAAAAGGTLWEDVAEPLRRTPCLSADQLLRLAEVAMTIERYYKRPQEIEWTFKGEGQLHVLQARPLGLKSPLALPRVPVQDALHRAEIIFQDRGTIAQRGVAVGPVVVVNGDTDLDRFPHGAILVSKFTSPRFSRVMCKARGIITDVGSPVGHMANLAREYRVPAVVDTGIATQVLREGDQITLDATQNVVFRGGISELDHFELTEEVVFEESYEYRQLRRLLKRISPLNLVDPHSPDFTPAACRTYHDITRYIHEKAVAALIDLSEKYGSRHASSPRRLDFPIPLGLLVIDAGGAVAPASDHPAAGTITAERIACLPLTELLGGIQQSGLWCTDPISVDMGSFMSSFTRTFCASLAQPQKVGRNLAVISKEYMNLHLRLGYHFTIIDAYIGDTDGDNYIYFRFLGGVTDFLHRSRRAKFIREILERFDFRVELHGDLVVGRIKTLSAQRMARRMRMLGGLIGYTRQLDALMHDDGQIAQHVDLFLDAIHNMIGGTCEQ